MKNKKKYAPPRTRKEAAERIVKMTNHLYDYKAEADEIVAALTDAAHLVIDRSDDPEAKARLIRMFDSTYDRFEFHG